jgi:Spy/CpxP family protein refolding chaperone
MFESKMPEMPYSKSKETDLNPDSESHKIEHISKTETKPKAITDKNTDEKKKIEAKLKEILEQERRNFDEPPYQIKEQTTEQNHTYPVLETKKQNLDFDSLDKLFYKTFVPSSSEKTVFNDLSLLQKQEKQLRKINKKDKIVVVDNTESLLEWIKQTKIKGMDAVVAIGCRFADKGDEPSYLAKQVAATSAQLEKISKELVLSSGKEKIGTSITEAESLYEYIEQNLK